MQSTRISLKFSKISLLMKRDKNDRKQNILYWYTDCHMKRMNEVKGGFQISLVQNSVRQKLELGSARMGLLCSTRSTGLASISWTSVGIAGITEMAQKAGLLSLSGLSSPIRVVWTNNMVEAFQESKAESWLMRSRCKTCLMSLPFFWWELVMRLALIPGLEK